MKRDVGTFPKGTKKEGRLSLGSGQSERIVFKGDNGSEYRSIFIYSFYIFTSFFPFSVPTSVSKGLVVVPVRHPDISFGPLFFRSLHVDCSPT